MTMNPRTFQIDEDSSDDETLFVDIPGRCSVNIHVTDEGVVVDVWAANAALESAATCGATWDEITATEEQ